MLIALSIVIVVLLGFVILGYALSGPKYSGATTNHFDGKKFLNPGGIRAKGLGDVLKWAMNRKQGPWMEGRSVPEFAKPLARVEQGIRITFVNHSTFLIQAAGLNFLTDPVWAERASPFSFAGPRRKKQPGIALADLPPIDVVLLSHNHYDHLDVGTLKEISHRHNPRIITPLGVRAFLEDKEIGGAVDLDWWESFSLNATINITATPAQHFSGRGTFDRDCTLWCGFMIKSKEGNIYFAGDTGYNPVTFKEIGQREKPVLVALIPIGAYKPQWFMSPIHCSPEEAVQIHKDVMANRSIATHFGTFALADEGEDDPKSDLEVALRKEKISPEVFMILKEGEARYFE